MFFRTKKSGPRTYLQLVENHWRDGRPQQTVLATLGRLDELQQRGAVDGLLRSGARFADKLLVLTAHQQGHIPAVRTLRLGAVLIFERDRTSTRLNSSHVKSSYAVFCLKKK